ALLVVTDIEGAFRWRREFVAESDMSVGPIHHRLDALPGGRRVPEKLPRHLCHPVHFAVSACQEEGQTFIRQLVHRVKLGTVDSVFMAAAVLDDVVVMKAQFPRWR